MGGEGGLRRSYSLERVLTDKHIGHILRQATGAAVGDCELVCSEVKPATDGLSGFLGDHLRVALHVKCNGRVEKVHLFVKRLPVANKPKADFIQENNYFKREMLMLQLLDEMKGAEGPDPWCAKAYIYTDALIVMPDLALAGYELHPLMETMDWRHVLLTARALARYHAAFANYEANRTLDGSQPFDFYNQYKHLLVEPTFQATPWVRTAAKLTADFLEAFSAKYTKKTIPNLEATLAKLFVKACETLDVAEESLNVMIHKDLWNNNVLFKYDDGVPVNAILIDYQCVRYGPPAFDLMIFIYLTTSRSFREENETEILKHYYEIFAESLQDSSRKHLERIGYDEKEFLSWCEKSRMFGILEALAIFPQVLMDARTAEKIFDDPETFMKIAEQDRSGPVVDYARKNDLYKQRQLEISEEFVERYVMEQP